jgi:hypothetical protein
MLLIWVSGYSRRASAGAQLGDSELLQKLGGAVSFAALVACLEWALASLSFTAGASFLVKVAVGVLAGLMGCGFVLVFDRTMLFLMDTRVDDRSMGSFLIIRIVVILAFASFTSERVLQVVLRQEMQHTALVMRTQFESGQQAELRARFAMPQLERREDSARVVLQTVQSQNREIPAPIREAIARAAQCWRAVAIERSNLVRSGHTLREARAIVAGAAAACRRSGNEAQRQLRDWRTDMAEQLKSANERLKDAHAQQARSADEVDRRIDDAAAIEREAVRPGSQRVLWRTIVGTPTAAAMAFFVVILSASVQLLPFALKSRAGQTGLGTGLGGQREAGRVAALSRLRTRIDEAEAADAASRAMAQTMVAAVESEEFRSQALAHAIQHGIDLTPLYAAVHKAREMANAQGDVDDVARQVPELAAMIYRIWTDAIAQVGPNPPRATTS